MRLDEVSEGDDLEKAKNAWSRYSKFNAGPRGVRLTEGGHMLAGPDGLETNERDLHTGQRTDGVPRRISHVKSAGEPTHENQDQGVKWDHVGNESVSTYESHGLVKKF